jgi:putative MATE family efflux protein
MFGGAFLSSAMRGVGDSRSPLYFQAMALVCTAVLDPLLMFGLLGLPRLGLNGTAVATLLSHTGAFASLAVYVQFRDHIVAPDWRRLRLHLPTTLLTAKIGIPTMIQQAMVSVGMLFIVTMINRFGAHSAAAFGIAMRIDQLAFMPAMTIGMAVSTLAGQNIGAGRFDRVPQVFRWGCVVSCAFTAVASLLALSLPAQLIGLFTSDADVIVIGAQYLRIVGLGYLMFAIMFVSNGVINGSGQTFITTVFTFITFWAVRVPLAAYLSHHTGRVEGIWYAVLASLVVGTVASLSYYLTGRWKRAIIRKAPSPALKPAPEAE